MLAMLQELRQQSQDKVLSQHKRGINNMEGVGQRRNMNLVGPVYEVVFSGSFMYVCISFMQDVMIGKLISEAETAAQERIQLIVSAEEANK